MQGEVTDPGSKLLVALEEVVIEFAEAEDSQAEDYRAVATVYDALAKLAQDDPAAMAAALASTAQHWAQQAWDAEHTCEDCGHRGEDVAVIAQGTLCAACVKRG